MNLIRYIHLNPVRAGIVKKPEDFKWSGHNAYLGIDPIAWLESDNLLSKLSSERSEAVIRYNNFVYAGIGVEPEFDFKIGNQAGILGDDKFLEEVIGSTKDFKSSRTIISLPEFVNLVCKKYEVSFSDLSSSVKVRQLSEVRGALALLVRESEQYTLVELGGIIKRNSSGLSQLANRLASSLQNNTKVQEEINALKSLQYLECENLPSDP